MASAFELGQRRCQTGGHWKCALLTDQVNGGCIVHHGGGGPQHVRIERFLQTLDRQDGRACELVEYRRRVVTGNGSEPAPMLVNLFPVRLGAFDQSQPKDILHVREARKPECFGKTDDGGRLDAAALRNLGHRLQRKPAGIRQGIAGNALQVRAERLEPVQKSSVQPGIVPRQLCARHTLLQRSIARSPTAA